MCVLSKAVCVQLQVDDDDDNDDDDSCTTQLPMTLCGLQEKLF